MSKTKLGFSTGKGFLEKVDKATNATYAQYASSDTSKGTIEERLTKLGFKQGVIEGLDSSYYSLKRQGNYVIGYIGMLNATSGEVVVTLPVNFRPKETYTMGYAVSTTDMSVAHADVTISTDGTIVFTITGGGASLLSTIYLGFEASPIQ